MKPEVIIIRRPEIDFSVFLSITLKILNRSLVSAADASTRNLTDAERFLSCLAAMSDPDAAVGLDAKLLPHITYSILIVADSPDILDIVECAVGMPFVFTETVARGVFMVVVTGTLTQWQAAVLAGSASGVEATVRYTYNQIYGQFRNEGLNLWAGFQQKQTSDRVTFLLEDKRGH